MFLRLIVLSVGILVVPIGATAQSVDTILGTAEPFSVSLSPQYPASESSVTLSFLSSALDLSNATLAVSVNGKSIYSGSVRPVTLTTGKAGSVSSVVATVTAQGTVYTQKLSISPQDVVLVAEPISSVPPLYPGKPAVPLMGDTRVVAVPHLVSGGVAIDPASLSYTWNVEGTELANFSGIGKQSLIVASPIQYRSRTVTVLVQNQSATITARASLSLSPQEPSLKLYENDPLLGIRFGRALTSPYTIRGAEAGFYAAPFSLPLTSGAPTVTWFLQGEKVYTGNVVTLRPSGKGEGSALLSLTATPGTDTLNQATAALRLFFGTQSSNLFGL